MHAQSANGHVKFAVRIEGISGPDTLVLPDGSTTAAPISPGLLVIGRAANVIFKLGAPAGHAGLRELAEDGNPCPLIERLAREPGVQNAEFLVPNLHYQVFAKPGDRLHFAVMFVHSNDLFYAFGPADLKRFDTEHQPISGDMTRFVELWDAGTEANEAPGVGPSQAPRQAFPGAGTKTRDPVRPVSAVQDRFCYPPTEQVIRVTITPVA